MATVVEVFVDETYPDRGDDSYLLIAALCFYKSLLRHHLPYLKSLAQLGLQKQTQALVEWLGSVKVAGSIVNVRTDRILSSPRIRDWYSDIGTIARSNDLWSNMASVGIGLAIRSALKAGWRIDYARIFHDSKSLAPSHEKAFARTLKPMVGVYSRNLAGGRGQSKVPLVRSVRSVAKPARGVDSRPEQVGTWLADRLAKLPQLVDTSRLPASIQVVDVTQLVETWTWGED